MIKIDNAPKGLNEKIAQVEKARKEWLRIKSIDKDTKAKVLKDNVFCDEESGERITDYKRDFLMNDRDFEKYCELTYNENLKKGIDSGGAGLTFWGPKKAVINAEDELIDFVSKIVPQFTAEVAQETKNNLKFRERFLKIHGL